MDGSIASAELAAAIQGWIEEWEPVGWVQRACKEDYNALTLHTTLIYVWALQPDGTVIWWDHEAVRRDMERETNPLRLYAVLRHGAREHPELEALVPAPPEGARPCDQCGATGWTGGEGDPEWCWACNGMGWSIVDDARPPGAEPCEPCEGTGFRLEALPANCPICEGRGWRVSTSSRPRDTAP